MLIFIFLCRLVPGLSLGLVLVLVLPTATVCGSGSDYQIFPH